ncbi:ferrous iron transport protein B [Bdellovibrionota bacterium FG-1]
MSLPALSTQRIVIVGNMNVGKTTLFSQLCGAKTKSVNFPGSTVSLTSGAARGLPLDVIDTPGTTSIFGSSEDERVSRDTLFSTDPGFTTHGIILVGDAKNLRRSLALILQYAEFGVPLLLDLNMIDEAQSRGITIDTEALSVALGVPVCTTVATEGRGIPDLKSYLTALKTPKQLVKYPTYVEDFITLNTKLLTQGPVRSIRAIAILLLTGDKSIEPFLIKNFGEGTLEQLKTLAEQYRRKEPAPFNNTLAEIYNKAADAIVKRVQQIDPPTKGPYIEKFGRWCSMPLTGIPIALLVATLMFLFVGSFGATFLVDLINGKIFGQILMPIVHKLVAPLPSAFLRDMIADPDFGLVPMGLFLAAGLVFPVLVCFYFFYGFLEDSGYLPRFSVLLDRAFQGIGLNGKGVLPIVMGFSCVTMAILTTRMLDTRKQKIIATMILLLGVPCAPMLAVMFIILSKMPVSATLTIVGIICLQILLMGVLANRLIPGPRSSLLMELPPMRIPKPMRVLKGAFVRSLFFMKEAVPVFIAASVVVFVFSRLGGLTIIEKALHPIAVGMLGLPDESVTVFIKTMIRKESGAATLEHYSLKYTNLQLVVNLLMMLLLMPCLNSVVVIIKEQGRRAGFSVLAIVTTYSLALGTVLNHFCRLMNITFK